jgi:hypothetical protein
VPVVRALVLTALLTLALFALFAAMPGAREAVSAGTAGGSDFFLSFADRLLRESFLLVAALLGATFAALYRASSYVLSGTYDPQYTYTYVVRLVLGAFAGLLLAEFVPVDELAGLGALTTPALALLGGFCAPVVYAILQRLIAAVEAIFQGGAEKRAAADIASARASAVAGAEAERRQHFERAVEVRESLRTGNVGEAAQRVNVLIDSLRTT